MSGLFHVIDDVHVILRNKRGHYHQAKVYTRGNAIYAGLGGAFVKLFAREGTSDPNVSWSDLTNDARIVIGRVGPPTFDGSREMKEIAA